MNDAEPQRSFGSIPDGTFVKAVMSIRPGGQSLDGMDAMDTGLFKASKSSDAMMLDCEFTVIWPKEYEHRKWWENMVIAGGSCDEKGVSKGWNMSKSRIRAMLESATNTAPDDMSAEAKAKRVVGGLKQLDGIPFFAKLRIEEGGAKDQGGFFPDKNVIDRIIVPGDEEYAPLARGEAVAAKPAGGVGRAKTTAGATAAPAKPAGPAWGGPKTVTPAQVQQGIDAQAPAKAAPAGPSWLSR